LATSRLAGVSIYALELARVCCGDVECGVACRVRKGIAHRTTPIT
jgi:hypothetical protein